MATTIKEGSIITGKDTDPYIIEPNDIKTPWGDARIAREELEKMKPAK